MRLETMTSPSSVVADVNTLPVPWATPSLAPSSVPDFLVEPPSRVGGTGALELAGKGMPPSSDRAELLRSLCHMRST